MLTIARRLAVAALALTGALTFVAVASAAQATPYGGTTSQKVGGSPVRLTLTVSHGAVSNVQVAALVTKGATICAVNVGSSSFVFSKGKAKINRSHKFSGKLTDGHGDSMTITGLAKPARVTGSFVIKSTGGASGATTCNSGKVRFSAQASGGAGGPHQVLGLDRSRIPDQLPRVRERESGRQPRRALRSHHLRRLSRQLAAGVPLQRPRDQVRQLQRILDESLQ